MFDELFKKVCEKEGYDWRLVSAIAYSESRFNPFLVSHRGAQGLMQIMPRVARQFDVEGDVMDPENNVLLALKILGKIENSLDFAPATSDTDRLKIVLACYNGGIGHVVDARIDLRQMAFQPIQRRLRSTQESHAITTLMNNIHEDLTSAVLLALDTIDPSQIQRHITAVANREHRPVYHLTISRVAIYRG